MDTIKSCLQIFISVIWQPQGQFWATPRSPYVNYVHSLIQPQGHQELCNTVGNLPIQSYELPHCEILPINIVIMKGKKVNSVWFKEKNPQKYVTKKRKHTLTEYFKPLLTTPVKIVQI